MILTDEICDSLLAASSEKSRALGTASALRYLKNTSHPSLPN